MPEQATIERAREDEHEGRGAASTRAISRQTHAAARRKTSLERSATARKAARTRMSR